MRKPVSNADLIRPYPNARYRQIPYDLVRELTLACLGTLALVVLLAGAFSTPDVPALSAQQVARQDPLLLVQTELNALSGQSAIATYGPPYNHGDQSLQSLGVLSPQAWSGVQIPIDTAQVDVLRPLSLLSKADPSLALALQTWNRAPTSLQDRWMAAMQKELKPSYFHNGLLAQSADSNVYGPLFLLSNAYLRLAQSGLLEDAIDGANGPSALTNRTKSLLLFENNADSAYAKKLNMLGNEWGVIKETGDYPGAVWLWYYTLLYQIPPYSTSSSADLLVVISVIVVTLVLILVPFIPGLRSIPRGLGIYRLIWRSHYRLLRNGGSPYEEKR